LRSVPDDMVTVTELAERWGVTTRTVQRMVARGELTPAMQLRGRNGAYLFNRADVEALKQQESVPDTEPAA
jgi:excisionase family DNA binding protein